MKKILLLLLFAFTFSGCEKDDICDSTASTTPQVVIEFYDNTQQSVLKNVVNLKVKADGVSEAIVFNPTLTPDTNPERFLFNGSKLILPLRTDGTSTKYSLILNSTLPASLNEDFLEFNYTTNTVYISRACGYKITYDLDETNPVVQTEGTDGKWIQNIDVETTNIDDEKTTHIKIYF
jgi:hypothetical protein